ncbi:hypothetical protein KSP39_PZI000380 [Platanthera zijinensis]|uniref:F-box domain-containing protein n=1 Tax=Platanthera zijinensis TaxID=2320716 RepID=A0AAP0C0P9_9ASPA
MEEERRWEDLSYDCLVRIFCDLGMEDLVLGLPFVCKSWREASADPQCWKNLNFREVDLGAGSRFARGFQEAYCVERFSLSSFMKICVARSHGAAIELSVPYIVGASFLPDLIYASIECPKLKVLALPSLVQKDEKQLPLLISRWRELEVLEIAWKPSSFLEILEQIRVNCPNLMGLHLCGFFDISDALAIVRCAPRLKILVMSASFLRKRDLVEILDGCVELEVVDVSECRGFAADHEILKKASRINKFECGGCRLEENYDSLLYGYDDDSMIFAW